MPQKRNKPGPKPKIGPDEQKQVLAALGVGGSLKDAAALIGVDYKTLYNLRRNDAEFSKGVRRAVQTGKLKLLQKVSSAKAWQAAAWMLERKWGAEFGRKDRHEHTGPGGGPMRSETTHKFDHDQFARELDEVRRERGVAAGRGVPPNGN